ncbi:hypothetical protein BLNAU_12693 [Blattamonas nauphoetae]|uniref:Uncharacterized protein n=1 Tax=Blattamonas nauphoetae TaxID=2049346 RepID=A0ABQ9XJ24_9EUKA|nr:hypothetical protein BLNAU_12693 [Blattamonas nauphoetae]
MYLFLLFQLIHASDSYSTPQSSLIVSRSIESIKSSFTTFRFLGQKPLGYRQNIRLSNTKTCSISESNLLYSITNETKHTYAELLSLVDLPENSLPLYTHPDGKSVENSYCSDFNFSEKDNLSNIRDALTSLNICTKLNEIQTLFSDLIDGRHSSHKQTELDAIVNKISNCFTEFIANTILFTETTHLLKTIQSTIESSTSTLLDQFRSTNFSDQNTVTQTLSSFSNWLENIVHIFKVETVATNHNTNFVSDLDLFVSATHVGVIMERLCKLNTIARLFSDPNLDDLSDNHHQIAEYLTTLFNQSVNDSNEQSLRLSYSLHRLYNWYRDIHIGTSDFSTDPLSLHSPTTSPFIFSTPSVPSTSLPLASFSDNVTPSSHFLRHVDTLNFTQNISPMLMKWYDKFPFHPVHPQPVPIYCGKSALDTTRFISHRTLKYETFVNLSLARTSSTLRFHPDMTPLVHSHDLKSPYNVWLGLAYNAEWEDIFTLQPLNSASKPFFLLETWFQQTNSGLNPFLDLIKSEDAIFLNLMEMHSVWQFGLRAVGVEDEHLVCDLYFSDGTESNTVFTNKTTSGFRLKLDPQQLYHGAVMGNNGSLYFFLNGQEIASVDNFSLAATLPTPRPNNMTFTFGGSYNATFPFFFGDKDSPKVQFYRQTGVYTEPHVFVNESSQPGLDNPLVRSLQTGFYRSHTARSSFANTFADFEIINAPNPFSESKFSTETKIFPSRQCPKGTIQQNEVCIPIQLSDLIKTVVEEAFASGNGTTDNITSTQERLKRVLVQIWAPSASMFQHHSLISMPSLVRAILQPSEDIPTSVDVGGCEDQLIRTSHPTLCACHSDSTTAWHLPQATYLNLLFVADDFDVINNLEAVLIDFAEFGELSHTKVNLNERFSQTSQAFSATVKFGEKESQPEPSPSTRNGPNRHSYRFKDTAHKNVSSNSRVSCVLTLSFNSPPTITSISFTRSQFSPNSNITWSAFLSIRRPTEVTSLTTLSHSERQFAMGFPIILNSVISLADSTDIGLMDDRSVPQSYSYLKPVDSEFISWGKTLLIDSIKLVHKFHTNQSSPFAVFSRSLSGFADLASPIGLTCQRCPVHHESRSLPRTRMSECLYIDPEQRELRKTLKLDEKPTDISSFVNSESVHHVGSIVETRWHYGSDGIASNRSDGSKLSEMDIAHLSARADKDLIVTCERRVDWSGDQFNFDDYSQQVDRFVVPHSPDATPIILDNHRIRFVHSRKSSFFFEVHASCICDARIERRMEENSETRLWMGRSASEVFTVRANYDPPVIWQTGLASTSYVSVAIVNPNPSPSLIFHAVFSATQVKGETNTPSLEISGMEYKLYDASHPIILSVGDAVCSVAVPPSHVYNTSSLSNIRLDPSDPKFRFRSKPTCSVVSWSSEEQWSLQYVPPSSLHPDWKDDKKTYLASSQTLSSAFFKSFFSPPLVFIVPTLIGLFFLLSLVVFCRSKKKKHIAIEEIEEDYLPLSRGYQSSEVEMESDSNCEKEIETEQNISEQLFVDAMQNEGHVKLDFKIEMNKELPFDETLVELFNPTPTAVLSNNDSANIKPQNETVVQSSDLNTTQTKSFVPSPIFPTSKHQWTLRSNPFSTQLSLTNSGALSSDRYQTYTLPHALSPSLMDDGVEDFTDFYNNHKYPESGCDEAMDTSDVHHDRGYKGFQSESEPSEGLPDHNEEKDVRNNDSESNENEGMEANQTTPKKSRKMKRVKKKGSTNLQKRRSAKTKDINTTPTHQRVQQAPNTTSPKRRKIVTERYLTDRTLLVTFQDLTLNANKLKKVKLEQEERLRNGLWVKTKQKTVSYRTVSVNSRRDEMTSDTLSIPAPSLTTKTGRRLKSRNQKMTVEAMTAPTPQKQSGKQRSVSLYRLPSSASKVRNHSKSKLASSSKLKTTPTKSRHREAESNPQRSSPQNSEQFNPKKTEVCSIYSAQDNPDQESDFDSLDCSNPQTLRSVSHLDGVSNQQMMSPTPIQPRCNSVLLPNANQIQGKWMAGSRGSSAQTDPNRYRDQDEKAFFSPLNSQCSSDKAFDVENTPAVPLFLPSENQKYDSLRTPPQSPRTTIGPIPRVFVEEGSEQDDTSRNDDDPSPLSPSAETETDDPNTQQDTPTSAPELNELVVTPIPVVSIPKFPLAVISSVTCSNCHKLPATRTCMCADCLPSRDLCRHCSATLHTQASQSDQNGSKIEQSKKQAPKRFLTTSVVLTFALSFQKWAEKDARSSEKSTLTIPFFKRRKGRLSPTIKPINQHHLMVCENLSCPHHTTRRTHNQNLKDGLDLMDEDISTHPYLFQCSHCQTVLCYHCYGIHTQKLHSDHHEEYFIDPPRVLLRCDICELYEADRISQHRKNPNEHPEWMTLEPSRSILAKIAPSLKSCGLRISDNEGPSIVCGRCDGQKSSSSRFSTQSAASRLTDGTQNYADRLEFQKMAAEQLRQQAELNECTFQPNIGHPKKEGRRHVPPKDEKVGTPSKQMKGKASHGELNKAKLRLKS